MRSVSVPSLAFFLKLLALWISAVASSPSSTTDATVRARPSGTAETNPIRRAGQPHKGDFAANVLSAGIESFNVHGALNSRLVVLLGSGSVPSLAYFSSNSFPSWIGPSWMSNVASPSTTSTTVAADRARPPRGGEGKSSLVGKAGPPPSKREDSAAANVFSAGIESSPVARCT